MPSGPAALALERLYGASLDDFLALRKQLATELRSAGDIAASKAVAAAPKPTRTAWALNQISRQHPELPRALLRARDQASGGSSGDADGLRQAAREYRERLSDVVRAARDLMVQNGMELNAIQMRRMTETLQAACAEEGGTRSHLLDGTLARDAEADDPLAMLAAGSAEPARPRPDPAVECAREKGRREREEHTRAVVAARAAVVELEGVAREALAQQRAAQAETDRARRAAEQADARLAEAREKLAQLEGSHRR
jgi:hypothetical protein